MSRLAKPLIFHDPLKALGEEDMNEDRVDKVDEDVFKNLPPLRMWICLLTPLRGKGRLWALNSFHLDIFMDWSSHWWCHFAFLALDVIGVALLCSWLVSYLNFPVLYLVIA